MVLITIHVQILQIIRYRKYSYRLLLTIQHVKELRLCISLVYLRCLKNVQCRKVDGRDSVCRI